MLAHKKRRGMIAKLHVVFVKALFGAAQWKKSEKIVILLIKLKLENWKMIASVCCGRKKKKYEGDK